MNVIAPWLLVFAAIIVIVELRLVPLVGSLSQFAVVGAALYMLLLVWSGVGLLRSAVRTLRDQASGLTARLLSVCALLLLAAFLAISAYDLQRLGLLPSM
jgi:hypothetical protein